MITNPLDLKDEARDEAYEYFDKKVRSLPKDSTGKINPSGKGLEDNDVDAFRHAYVSGVFTLEYGEQAADTFGRLNEMNPFGNSGPDTEKAKNMDFWNNAVGRKCGLKAKDRKALLILVHRALENGELIISLEDKRQYNGATHDPVNKSKPIIVIEEGEKGRNQIFFDTSKGMVLSVQEFISLIEAGEYPGYTVKIINGSPTPVSLPDSREPNNLG
jgi:hypothetical protein